jgi:hypothetical protein
MQSGFRNAPKLSLPNWDASGGGNELDGPGRLLGSIEYKGRDARTRDGSQAKRLDRWNIAGWKSAWTSSDTGKIEGRSSFAKDFVAWRPLA